MIKAQVSKRGWKGADLDRTLGPNAQLAEVCESFEQCTQVSEASQIGEEEPLGGFLKPGDHLHEDLKHFETGDRPSALSSTEMLSQMAVLQQIQRESCNSGFGFGFRQLPCRT
jgi:hypothetical protein